MTAGLGVIHSKFSRADPGWISGSSAFPHRIVDIWNDLPEHLIQTKTVERFEGRLDKFLRNQPLLYNYKANYMFDKKDTGRVRPESDIDLVQEA